MNKIAICQPYFSPYLGYFQLINAVDLFVSYDDVNFIKKGWINRNKLWVNNNENLFTIPLKNQSQNIKICHTEIDWKSKDITKFVKKLKYEYGNTPFFKDVNDIVISCFEEKPPFISELAFMSLKKFCIYLDIKTQFKVSSTEGYEKTPDRSQNLINICKQEGHKHYINPIGGVGLYDKNHFLKRGIKLNFIQGKQSLSIIDVCMKNEKEKIKTDLLDYNLL